MTPTEKALLLQAVAEMTKVNNIDNLRYISISDNCREAANLILESIKEDFKEKEK